MTHYASNLAEAVRESLATDPALAIEELDTGWRELQRAQRNALQSPQCDRVISQNVFEQLMTENHAQWNTQLPVGRQSDA